MDKHRNLCMIRDYEPHGITASSGTNSQHWTFTIIPDRPSMVEFGHLVAAFYRRLNLLAAHSMGLGTCLIGLCG